MPNTDSDKILNSLLTPQPGSTNSDSTTTPPLGPLPETIEAILATLASSKAQRITPPCLSESEKNLKKRRWLDSWLKLKITHPQLTELENEIYDFVSGYSKQPGRGAGKRLLIFGENGSGKSHTLKAISRWHYNVAWRWDIFPRITDLGDTPYSLDRGVITERKPECERRNWARLLKTIKGGEWNAVETLCHADLVIIDDVGAEHDPTKFAVGELYELLERRERDWTIITTNVAPDKWEERFERRIASRFVRNFTHVSLAEVPDYNSQA